MTPLVFLHGFLGAPSDWEPIVRRLDVARSMHALTLPVAECWQLGVQQLECQLPPEFVVIGYSLGARIALALALTYPSRTRGLCFVSGHPGLQPAERAVRRVHDQGVIERMLQMPWPEFLDEWYRQEVFSSLDRATRMTWVQQKQTLDRDYQAELLRCYSISGQPNYWQQLSNIATPTLVIAGQHDCKYVAVARSMQRCAPQLELQIVPMSGHAVHRERPTEFAEVLQAFLATLTPGE